MRFRAWIFFCITLLAAFLIGLSLVFSSPVLLVAGLAFSPLLSPLTGTALGLVTGSFRFAVRNLAALVVAWILAFIAAWASAYLFSFLPARGEYPPMPDLFTAFVVVLASAALTWRFLRGAPDAWMPNLVVAYGGLYPICAAAGLMAAGEGGAASFAWLTWGIHTGLSLLASIGTYLAFGFRPSERNVRAYAGMAAACVIGLALIAAWVGTAPAAAPAPAPAAGTLEPILLPTASSTLTLRPSLTLSPTIAPLPSQTPKPSATLTPTPTPIPAVVRGTGGQGVFLRDAPGLDWKENRLASGGGCGRSARTDGGKRRHPVAPGPHGFGARRMDGAGILRHDDAGPDPRVNKKPPGEAAGRLSLSVGRGPHKKIIKFKFRLGTDVEEDPANPDMALRQGAVSRRSVSGGSPHLEVVEGNFNRLPGFIERDPDPDFARAGGGIQRVIHLPAVDVHGEVLPLGLYADDIRFAAENPGRTSP